MNTPDFHDPEHPSGCPACRGLAMGQSAAMQIDQLGDLLYAEVGDRNTFNLAALAYFAGYLESVLEFEPIYRDFVKEASAEARTRLVVAPVDKEAFN